ncbi:MAG: T9SS type A sorting domain-containing protein [Bacteroidales bacterium]|nr:T9SS type A sorting domain-containing protein [Bacteroidales bacterium]
MIIIGLNTNAQRECNIWYFGEKHGIDLNHDTVKLLTNSSMFTDAANATISDKFGNLLFYTNGETVWNAQHDTMPNGNGLAGCTLADDCMIVPHPGDNKKYFIFTHDCIEAPMVHGLQYSIVDMEMDNGLGDVSGRNISLGVSSIERMLVVQHCNRRDYWLIVHSPTWIVPYDEFYTFLISPKGVNPTPIVCPTTFSIEPFNFIIEANTNIIYATNVNANHLCKFQFNIDSGNIQFLDSLFIPPNLGLIFSSIISPDGSKLYSTEGSDTLCQYDISIGTDSLIAASRAILYPSSKFYGMTLSRNGMLFLPIRVENSGHNIIIINNPNQLASSGNLISDTFLLINPITNPRVFLPSFIAGFRYSNSFEWDHVCLGDTTQFTYLIPECDSIAAVTDLYWEFGDSASGAANSSIDMDPVHYYSQAGEYKVRLITVSSQSIDTVYKTIAIVENPVPDLGADIDSLQPGSQVTLDAGPEYWDYAWSTGETSQAIEVSQTDVFSLTVTDRYGCMGVDDINVNYISIDEFKPSDLIQLYPNPTRDILVVYSDFSILEIEIFNLVGQRVLLQKALGKEVQIDISGLTSGKYIIKTLIKDKTVIKEFIVL